MAYLFQATVDNSQQIWSKYPIIIMFLYYVCTSFQQTQTFGYLLLGQLSGNKQGVSLNSKNIFIVEMWAIQ